jgi:ATP-binding cassette ChvD family protein
MAILVSGQALSKQFGARPLFRDITIGISDGERMGLVGPNGSGKSTLLRIFAGLEPPDSGVVSRKSGIRVEYAAQEDRLPNGSTVLDVLEDALADMALEDYERSAAISTVMDDAGIPDASQLVDSLSGGWRKRLSLLRALVRRPDLLLLDEPTNHLDAESVAWLELHLQRYSGTVIAVTHDRYFLDNVAGWILELDRGEGIPWKGNYSSWLEQKEQRLEKEQKADDKRTKTLQRELEWIRMSPKGRHAKSKARINDYERMVATESEKRSEDLEIFIPPGERLGDLVIEAQDVSKGYGDKLLFENLNFALPPGGIVGVIGPNGAGKTTLFRLITEQDKPDSGSFRVGPTVKLGYVDQSRDSLDANKTIWEEISDGADIINLGKREINSRAYVSRFNFSGTDQQKRVGMLSGGERNRVHLAKMLKSGANVLLLDEPTNDLDVNTMRALEEALENFAGCAVVISHDRWFLDRIATHILAFEGDSHVEYFDGNYSEYEADRRKRLGHDADTPHRIKYRYLTRA